MKKFGQILLDLLVCCFLIIVALMIMVVVVSNRDVDGTAEIFGYQLRIVTSDSMGECEHTDVSGFEIKSIPVESLIIVKVMPQDEAEADGWYKNVKAGDVLTFRYVYGQPITITHRVASITEKEGGYVIDLAGDNVNAKDNQLYQTIDTTVPNNPNYVIGKVVWNAKWAGQLLSAIRTPIGLIFLIWIPCVIITVMQVYEIGSGAGSSARRQKRAPRRVRYVPAPAPQNNLDAGFVRYVDRQYEKAEGRHWKKYARQYRRRKVFSALPRFSRQGKAYRSWKRYAQDYQAYQAPTEIPRINAGTGPASTPHEWKQYARNYQGSDRATPMPRFKGRNGRAK